VKKKTCRAGQNTDANMAHAPCMLDIARTHAHTHTHSEYVILIAFPLSKYLT